MSPRDTRSDASRRLVSAARLSVRGYQRPTPETELRSLLNNLQRISMRKSKAIKAHDMPKAAKLSALEERTRDLIEVALAKRSRQMDAPSVPETPVERKPKFIVERRRERFKRWDDR